MKTGFLIVSMFFLVAMPVFADDTIKIENNSFGVIRESQTDSAQNLILYIQNENCIAKYRVMVNEIVLGKGELNVQVLKKYIPFGNQDLEIGCGTLKSVSIVRQN